MTLSLTRRAGRNASVGDNPTGAFLAPLLILLALATVFPLGYAIYLSLFNWNWGSTFSFIGLGNYARVFGDAEYWASLERTVLFTVMAVGTEIVLGFVLALAVDRAGRNIGWLRTVFILPLMVSGIVVSLIWKVMLDPTIGVIPYLASLVGIPSLNLLGDPAFALPTVAGIDTWWQTGFVFVVLQAGLQSLPREPFEAAQLDGANFMQRLRYLTIPMMAPILLVVAGIRSIDCLKVFALVFGTTNGGPGQSTGSIQFYAYRTAFSANQMSYGVTLMVVFALLIGLVVLAILGVRQLRSRRG
ncbi:sugar ABC transporter permease [soil metagenome]